MNLGSLRNMKVKAICFIVIFSYYSLKRTVKMYENEGLLEKKNL